MVTVWLLYGIGTVYGYYMVTYNGYYTVYGAVYGKYMVITWLLMVTIMVTIWLC